MAKDYVYTCSDKECIGLHVAATFHTLPLCVQVRARVNYESISEGDFGVYRQTNDGTPPAQFAWDGLGGDTYWLFWHQVEILPPSNEKETGERERERERELCSSCLRVVPLPPSLPV